MNLLTKANPEYLLATYNELAKEALFPEQSKAVMLVIIYRDDKTDHSSFYRPFCYLHVEKVSSTSSLFGLDL